MAVQGIVEDSAPTSMLIVVAGILVWLLWLVLTAAVLRWLGATRREVKDWALKEASQRRLVEVIRAIRGKEPSEPQQLATKPCDPPESEP